MVVGDRKAVDYFKKQLPQHFKTMEEGRMTGNVGSMVKSYHGKLYLHQSNLIKKVERKFGDRIKKLHTYKSPGTPGEDLVILDDDEQVINDTDQTEYRSRVRMLLFLTKFSRPDIANAVRDLSTMNDRAGMTHVKEMLRVIKFVVDTRYWCLLYRISKSDREVVTWKLKAYSDSDFAGDKHTP